MKKMCAAHVTSKIITGIVLNAELVRRMKACNTVKYRKGLMKQTRFMGELMRMHVWMHGRGEVMKKQRTRYE